MGEKSSGNRKRLLFLRRYLMNYTDDQHRKTTEEILSDLEMNGFRTDRRTLYEDLAVLGEEELDIIREKEVCDGIRTSRWHVGSRLFETAELKILADAVSSAQFLTREKSDQLFGKLACLAAELFRKEIVPAVHVAEHIKADNNQMLYALERISEAIRTGKKISFQYYEYNVEKERVFRHGGEVYVLSPYATIWNDDQYYVAGWSDKRKTVVTFRLDKMPVPELLEEDAVPAPPSFSIQRYADTITRMYGGRETRVTLRCRRDLMNKIIDKFGLGVEISNITESTFDASATVSVSGTFLSWLFQYAGGMYLRGPEEVKRMYEDMIHVTSADMEGDVFTETEAPGWKL